MKISREWFTPLTLGSFILISATGVLMFFHLDSGMNKLVHKWFSWLLIAAVLTHITSNRVALKRHLTTRRTHWIVVALIAILATSFFPDPTRKPSIQKMAVQVLETASLAQITALKSRSIDQMQAHMQLPQIAASDLGLPLKEFVKKYDLDLKETLNQALSLP
jgi:uncharacterized membrane protein